MGEGESEQPVERIVVWRKRPLMNRFDAGCMGCLSFYLLASGVLGSALHDSEGELLTSRWMLGVGILGVLLALVLARKLPPLD